MTTSADSTRAVFELNGPLDYKLFEIGNPDRIVLDLRASNFAEGFATPAGRGLLKSVRTGKQGKDVRVVFDLATGVRPKSFLLQPADKAPYRLVVDLYPRGKAKAEAVKLASAPVEKPRDVVIAIDAGHGGDDPGATGAAGTREKEITLAVARELKRLIDKQPGMSAVLTRDSDYFIPLKQRYQKAREAKADLFVSVHADAYSSGDARGSSVWMLSARGATSEAARWLEDRENRADLVGGVSLDNKDNTLAAVLLDLSQGATLEASGAVANQVLQALAKVGPTHRGYVEKANFVVLRSPDVPSILVETAFITNPAEEKRLKSPEQREKIAKAILEGVHSYFVAAPPPGSLFAANARKDKSEQFAVRKTAPANVAVFADDDPDREVLARSPKS
ncbi:MAG TPA: N-acetylmuramoyl-L-alanine amidase [Rudaea sp.]|nr:N-acetylmuramoyl-L-alanine amidase [Rudaea sp.]